jgi:hypothetical protein
MEDAPFNLLVFQRIERMILLEEPLYFYVMRSGSTLHSPSLLPKYYLSRLSALRQMMQDLPKKNKTPRAAMLRRLLGRESFQYRNRLYGTAFNREGRRILRQNFADYSAEFLFSPVIPIKEKIAILYFWLASACKRHVLFLC